MTADFLLATLMQRGVSVRAEGEYLRLSPRELVPLELIDALRVAKPALLERLRSQDKDPVRRRVAVFRERGQPWVLYAGLTYSRGICFSCGDALDRHVIFGRCEACSEALWRVLADEPAARWPGRPH